MKVKNVLFIIFATFSATITAMDINEKKDEKQEYIELITKLSEGSIKKEELADFSLENLRSLFFKNTLAILEFMSEEERNKFIHMTRKPRPF